MLDSEVRLAVRRGDGDRVLSANEPAHSRSEFVEERLDGEGQALDFQRHGSVVFVSDPAGDGMRSGDVTGGGPETHSLHSA